MILVSMEKRDPTLYHGTKQSYFGPVNFRFTPPPLGKPCYKKKKKKGLVGRGIRHLTVPTYCWDTGQGTNMSMFLFFISTFLFFILSFPSLYTYLGQNSSGLRVFGKIAGSLVLLIMNYNNYFFDVCFYGICQEYLTHDPKSF